MGNYTDSIIIIYGPPWDQAAKLSKHHFASFWSQNKKVLYIEAPSNPLSFFTRKKEAKLLWKRYRSGPQKISNNLWITTFFYIFPFRGSQFFFGAKWINTINQFLIKRRLKKQIELLGMKNPTLIIGSAHILPIIDKIKSSKIIYHCSDDYTLVPSFPKKFKEIEESLIKKCDLVITTADELMIAKRHLNSNIVSIPNGADIEHFNKTQDIHTIISSEITKFSNPVIGYIGTIFRWINQEWIEFAANSHRELSFVFVGPVTTDISRLSKIKNIHFIGPKPYNNLPKYLKGFSVATIPFSVDGVTLKASPIKFYEYLASGIPIVSTDLPDLNPFRNHVKLVNSKEEFSFAIKESLQDKDQNKKIRMDLSKNYSWKSRFNELENHIKKINDNN
tara:strand:- start:30634 stop:31806 length:1173 start_codon:yes stop_codon:yes gene_type:complete